MFSSKTLIAGVGVLGIFSLGWAMIFAQGNLPDRQQLWRQVDEAISQGLPQTAIEHLNTIYDAATAADDWDDATKAFVQRLIQQQNIDGPNQTVQLQQLLEAAASRPEAMRPALQIVAAHWLANEFQQNQWRYADRTQTTTDIDASEIDTWSLPQLLLATAHAIEASLAGNADILDQPIADWERVLINVDQAAFRPTLRDVLLHEAIGLYRDVAWTMIAPQPLTIEADSPAFGSTEEFLAWQPAELATDGEGDTAAEQIDPHRRLIAHLQSLLRLHGDDTDQTALLHSDLTRLETMDAIAAQTGKAVRFREALEEFAQKHREHFLSSAALMRLAEIARGEEDLVRAVELAERAVERHPDSVPASNARDMIQAIKAPSLSIRTESIWSGSPVELIADYANLTRLHFRLFRLDAGPFLRQNLPYQYRQPEVMQRILSSQPAAAWQTDLPITSDYRVREEKIDVPTDVQPGVYMLAASVGDNFRLDGNILHAEIISVSDLAVVYQSSRGSQQALVIDAASGHPLAGARVTLHPLDGQPNASPITLTTDEQGVVSLQSASSTNHLVHVSHGNRELWDVGGRYFYRYSEEEPVVSLTKFFTDRAIYRPGQTIQYKGVSLKADRAENRYSVLANRNLIVVFRDANGEEIARQRHRTNRFGSFSGSLTAPTDRLTGVMTLLVEEGSPGSTSVRVEEYKRPKFEVELSRSDEEIELGQTVTVRGVATTYTGVPVSDAQVQYRVVRRINRPWFLFGYMGFFPPNVEEIELLDGRAVTDSDGKFSFDLPLTADPAFDETSGVSFSFEATANVTDTTGETRSDALTVIAGFRSLEATIQADDWLTTAEPVKLTVTTRSLSGEPLAASGKVKIHRLIEPAAVPRPPLESINRPFPLGAAAEEPPTPTSDPKTWPLGEVLVELPFETDATGSTTVSTDLPAGVYRAMLSTRDAADREVTAAAPLHVIDLAADRFETPLPFVTMIEQQSVAPGDTAKVFWGSGYDDARALIQVLHRDRLLRSEWTNVGKNQSLIEVPVTEELRGGFVVAVTMVHDNRLHTTIYTIDVPWSNKQLHLSWSRFVDRLKPDTPETWTLKIEGDNAQAAAAELVATLYDASLDAFVGHGWPSGFGVFYQANSRLQSTFANTVKHLFQAASIDQPIYEGRSQPVPQLDPQLIPSGGFRGRGLVFGRMGGGETYALGLAEAEAMPMMAAAPAAMADFAEAAKATPAALNAAFDAPPAPSDIDLSAVVARGDLRETAFFYPHLLAGDDGSVRIEFTPPQTLTRWKFFAFAHLPDLSAGGLTAEAVTAKDLMVQPNPPRFVREGDQLELTAKLSNRSDRPLAGKIALHLANYLTEEPLDERLNNTTPEQPFELEPGQSRSYRWTVKIADGTPPLSYRVVAASANLSDGEQGMLPVLSRKILVTESISLPIRDAGEKSFTLDKLAQSGGDESINHQALTLEVTSNPAWYAVLALPYLMEFPHECSEQVFSRIYANSIAQHLVESNPRIARVFEVWRGTTALESPLAKNANLKSVLLEETPWVVESDNETQQRQNVAVLFDRNRLRNELEQATGRLAAMQQPNGLWPWFPGGPTNEYISLHIVTGFGRLRHLGIPADMSMAMKAIPAIDDWMQERYVDSKDREQDHFDAMVALYLYGRSFYLADVPIPAEHQTAWRYWIDQAAKYWLSVPRLSQGHAAVALHRLDRRDAAQAIIKSLLERATVSEELGLYWRDTEQSWWWYRAPIETQAMMIEALAEVTSDTQSADAAAVWLIKQKQTQAWKSTKATADAVYAILGRGVDRLASDDLVQARLGGEPIQPEATEAGTGYYQVRFTGEEVDAQMGNVTLVKSDPGVAWGALHWQYFQDIDAITPHDGTPLSLSKDLFVKVSGGGRQVLQPVDGPVDVGDELVCRLILKSDRDMEFLHLKDYRGSGTEPVNVLSGYRYQDGLAYYESTRDAASHFFIDYLPKGTYVFEYSTRVQLRGDYSSGIAEVQCMYAPEFNSHSGAVRLRVE